MAAIEGSIIVDLRQNDFNELEKLARGWLDHNSYDPCSEAYARDSAINDCGRELFELLKVISEKELSPIVNRWNVPE